MDLAVFQARWQVADLAPDTVHVAATQLLEAGLDSPALVELAGATKLATRSDLDPLVRRALAELGRSPMSDSEARWVLAFEVARQITANEVEPLAGATRLWTLATDLGLPGQPLNYFVYLAADYAEGPLPQKEETQWFDTKIVETARELLDQRSAILASLQPTV